MSTDAQLAGQLFIWPINPAN